MNLANDYFLLYHGLQIEHSDIFEIDKNSVEGFFEISALILTVTRRNYERYLPLSSFKNVCSKLTTELPHNIDEMYKLQRTIVEQIQEHDNHDDIERLHSAFDYLRNEEIITNADCEKLTSLFDPEEILVTKEIEIEDDIDVDHTLSFKDLKSNLENVIDDLKGLINTSEYKEELDNTKSYLNNQKFSIGITGVMNAGKSTMLNALMGQEILGSAVVPETANLTIVKYDKNPSAKVFYWNKDEWSRIENTANDLDSIKEFVEETKTVFGNELKDYILPSSRNDEVDINNLALYTSAEASGKKCNLVKYVELRSNLTFLEDGIEIVDTPGLDDPVIQREEITKEYVSQCDMMLHLMNVSQSATLKDVEFIIDALLYQNISKLLVVITRADSVSPEQLEEVIEYTKTSIKRQLKAQNKDSKLDYILKTIKFIPISGKMALLHRTGREKEALEAGFKLEDTGILEIEDYLNETLFGSGSQKSKLLIKSAKSQILKTIEKEQKSLNYEIKLLSKSKDELEVELEEFTKKKKANEVIFNTMSDDINFYKSDAKNYITSLETFLTSELIDLQNVIKQRVVRDVSYSFEKTKKRPESSRTRVIVETAIKDGIIDVIRDYRYKFIKKSQTIGEQCEQKYQDFGFSIGHKNDNFDARGFFQDDFKAGFLTSSNEVLVSKIISSVEKSKASKIDILDREIDTYLKEEFTHIESNIKTKIEKVSILLIDSFIDTLNAPLKSFEQKLINDEKILQNQLKSYEDNDKNRDGLSLDIHKKLKQLDNISKDFKS